MTLQFQNLYHNLLINSRHSQLASFQYRVSIDIYFYVMTQSLIPFLQFE